MSKSEQRKKTIPVMLRMTPDERAVIAEKAADVNKTVPGYLIACGLGRKTRTAIDTHIVQELRQLGELQKALYRESGGLYSAEYGALLAEVIAAIKRLGA